MTKEQQQVFQRAVEKGLVRSEKDAYEAGAADLRRRLNELQASDDAAAEFAAREEASRQATLF